MRAGKLSLPRRESRPGLTPSSPNSPEGVARRVGAKPLGIRDPLEGSRRAPVTARHIRRYFMAPFRRLLTSGTGARIGCAPHPTTYALQRRWTKRGPPRPERVFLARGQGRAGMPSAMSPSVPRRPRAPCPVPRSRRLMSAPLNGRGRGILRQVWEAGIRRTAPQSKSPGAEAGRCVQSFCKNGYSAGGASAAGASAGGG
jgi:hypothetical protein